jgi:hypothetical protein
MRWPATWVCSLSLTLLGCPEVHRPGGFADQAAHKDALESLPERCTAEVRKKYCNGEQKFSEECRIRCGEVE